MLITNTKDVAVKLDLLEQKQKRRALISEARFNAKRFWTLNIGTDALWYLNKVIIYTLYAFSGNKKSIILLVH